MSHTRQGVRGVLMMFCLSLLVAMGAAGASGAPETKLKIGDTAPDFTLKDQSGKEVSLREFRGKKSVALAFYVFAFTGG